MKKIRVYELAKELKMTSKDLIKKMNDLELDVNSHMSTLDGEEVKVVKEFFEQENESEETDEESEEELEEEYEIIEIEDTIVVKDFADKMNVNSTEVITELIGLGVMASLNQSIDFETAGIIGNELGFKVIAPSLEDVEALEDEFDLDYEDEDEDLIPRPPVVTVMGHVDHGKTSLLDAIRKTRVTKQEAGGITQHIGASTVNVEGKKVVFLDTPGHEAFTSMRARGTQVTDLAILVVAADDGIMPQTIEAINHAKAAKVPIIVAINKIDKHDANLDRVKQELVDHGLIPEEWGGDTISVPVSALNNEGIDELLEMVLLVSEIEELKANPNRKAVGTVIEAQLDKGRGPVATVLVQKGTLSVGDMVVCGTASGRVRAMFDDKGKTVKKVGPSTPVMILGLSDVPNSGEMLYAVENEKTAKIYSAKKKEIVREEQLKSSQMISLDDLHEKIESGEIRELNIIIKADVRGTIDAIKQSLEKLEHEEVKVNVIHGGVGGITESDVMLASASNAIIIGFNIRPTLNALEIAKEEKVDVRTYRVIYEAIEDIKSAIKGMLKPKYVEEVIGRATVRATFKVPGGDIVAGIYVQQGKITRNSTLRLLRDDIVVFEGGVSSLKRFKDDVREVATGYEGGLGLENYNDIKDGDTLEAYVLKEVER